MRILGVVGTMVWDTIRIEDDTGSPMEEWGGITYALAAADAVVPPDYRVRPVVKLGHDLAERAMTFLDELAVIESRDAISVVDEPNPRVELHYRGQERRCERLRGGVPAWSWPELESRIQGCDALYLNFITGDEFDLTVAQHLYHYFDGPIYADVHSLMLQTGSRGDRSPRHLDRWAEWLACFDAVQMNEAELAAMSSHWGDPWAFAADVVGRDTRLLFVTLGPGGAAFFMAADATPLGDARHDRRQLEGPLRTGKVVAAAVKDGDPTGCGDVWGITAFSALLAGHDVEESMRRANAASSRNVMHRGASGLNRLLRGEIERAT
jgi:sugar/nucleoside kinase (ribokinase family)